MAGKPHYPYPGSIRSITQAQVGALLAELRRAAPRLVWVAAWTQYEVAGRVSEVIHLTPADVSTRYVYVRRLKGSNSTRVNVSVELLAEIRRVLEENASANSAYVFEGRSACKDGKKCKGRHISAQTIFRYVQTAGRAIGLDVGLCKTHVLRHSAITHSAEISKGEPINKTLRRLAEFSGHKDVSHLLHYLTNPEEEAAFIEQRSVAFGAITAGPSRVPILDVGVEVDELGNVYRNGARLTITPSGTFAYPFVLVGRQEFSVHHLVAEAFLGRRGADQIVRHLDDDKFHVHRDNLRYGTRKRNMADKRQRALPVCRQCSHAPKYYSNP